MKFRKTYTREQVIEELIDIQRKQLLIVERTTKLLYWLQAPDQDIIEQED